MNAARQLAFRLDPCLLMEAAGMKPDAWQRDVLRGTWGRALLLCSRQSGKSTVTGALALHRALFTPDSEVLLLSPSQRQSSELFKKVWSLYRSIGEPGEVENKSALRARFGNGSRILSLPGKEKTIRGFSGVDLLVFDEAARVPDDLYSTVRPMLAVSGGRMVALTTPFGRRGWYHDAWTSEEDWKRVRVTAEECPRITAEFLEEERRELGQWWYEQEYECRFVDTTGSLFKHEEIQGAFSEDVKPLFATTGEEDLRRSVPEPSEAVDPTDVELLPV